MTSPTLHSNMSRNMVFNLIILLDIGLNVNGEALVASEPMPNLCARLVESGGHSMFSAQC